MPAQPDSGSDQRLDLLLAEYEQVREDERNLTTIQAGVLSVAVTILAAIPFALQQTCGFQGRGFDLVPGKDDAPCTTVKNLWVIAAVPVVPLAVIAFLMGLGVISIFRTYYMRSLEDELQHRSYRLDETRSKFQPMSYMASLNEITSFRRGSATYKAIVGLLVGSVLVALGGLALYVAVNLPQPQKGVALVFFGAGTALLLSIQYQIVFRGPQLYSRARDRYLARRLAVLAGDASSSSAVRPRGLVSYFIIPRVSDLFKVAIAPLLALVLSLLAPVSFDIPVFLAIWITFELLVYQARYQWNDIIGLDGDLKHPQRSRRLRLPVGLDSAEQARVVALSWAVLLLKIILALALGWTVLDVGPQISWLTAGVALNAGFYEYLRNNPGSARFGEKLSRTMWKTGLLWLLILPGYGMRALIPFLASDVPLESMATLFFVLGFASLGLMNVLMIWTLEAASFCSVGPPVSAKRTLLDRPHLLRLLLFTELRPDRPGDKECTAREVEILRAGKRISTPWNFAGLAASVLLAASLCLLNAFSYSVVTLVVLGSSIVWVVCTRCEGPVVRMLIATASSTAIGTLLFISSSSNRPLMSTISPAIPLFAMVALYTNFRCSSYDSMIDGLKPLALRAWLIVRVSTLRAIRIATGKDLWDRLYGRPS